MRDASPPAFDPDHYRRANPDLAALDDAAAAAHYETRGRAEGRIASPFALREAFVAAIDATAPTLEIGPFCDPAVTGPAVRYLDVLDAAGLRARAAALGLDAERCPEQIHYVGTLDGVRDRFATAFSAHAIEHQPDLVRHLAEVAHALEPNGLYRLVVPDKRYCFDHFLAETTIADILDAFEDERTTHRLGDVVEQVALTTHNDPVRHWRGDHGGVDAGERTRRTAEAIAAHARADGGYLDIHAWQFTPAAFADAMTMLARLDLSSFEVEAVYDTPRDRAEFCAILRRARNPRTFPRRGSGPAVTMMQTADANRYAAMLAVTAPNVAEYCRRRGFVYESFVGLKRGHWAWQASFNRIAMLAEIVERGFQGWAIYLDADAYVRDMDFDLGRYLAERERHGAIVASSTITDAPWDVNSGMVMVNCRHPAGRRLVRRWAEALAALSDDALRARRDWSHPDDQDWLQAILREDEEVAAALLTEAAGLFNAPDASFIRQRQRTQFASFEARLAAIAEDVAETMRAAGAAPAAPHDGRDAARLLHPPARSAWLEEAPVPIPNVDDARALIATWRTLPAAEPPAHQAGLAAMLVAGDADGLARELVALGRSVAAEGSLGGARQHRRVRTDRGFALTRALRARGALLSLAELTGAATVENPDLGSWGANAGIAPAALFARITATLAADLSPPATIGAWLGVPVGGGLVLHQRMVEAIYAAWRLRGLSVLLGSDGGVLELGGGIGLAAHYAARLGIAGYATVADPIDRIVQHHVLGRDPGAEGAAAAIAFCDEALPAVAIGRAAAWLRTARERGARAFLSFHHEVAAQAGAATVTAVDLAAADDWRLVDRRRHGLRAGHVEELYVRRH